MENTKKIFSGYITKPLDYAAGDFTILANILKYGFIYISYLETRLIGKSKDILVNIYIPYYQQNLVKLKKGVIKSSSCTRQKT